MNCGDTFLRIFEANPGRLRKYIPCFMQIHFVVFIEMIHNAAVIKSFCGKCGKVALST